MFQAPDGMTIDEDGMLWVAMYNGWKASIHMKILVFFTFKATEGDLASQSRHKTFCEEHNYSSHKIR